MVGHCRYRCLATSTIGLDGTGRVVETPGGWQDFLGQNPGFFAAVPKAEAARPAPPKAAQPEPPRAKPSKLSYKDQRRLAELEALIEAAPGQIAKLEAALADPSLYGRDPAAFDKTNKALTKARADLSSAEEEWLTLEELKESLTAGG